MDYVEGDDLADMLQKRGGAFAVEEVLQWADQLLDALSYLHKQNPPVIHRDIKPQNLKLLLFRANHPARLRTGKGIRRTNIESHYVGQYLWLYTKLCSS